jgi:23S rRNA A2030 N6-methylase RlmJ
MKMQLSANLEISNRYLSILRARVAAEKRLRNERGKYGIWYPSKINRSVASILSQHNLSEKVQMKIQLPGE